MLALKKVAVTGGLASGKSTVCRFLKDRGAYVRNADEIAHDLIAKRPDILKKLLLLFPGKEIITKGLPDRKKIANFVFKNPMLLERLENLLHPPVLEELKKEYVKVASEKAFPLFVAEVPLLFETNFFPFFDVSIAVIAPEETCKERFLQRSGGSESDFYERRRRQLSPEDSVRKADYAIRNDGDLNHLKKETMKIYEKITR